MLLQGLLVACLMVSVSIGCVLDFRVACQLCVTKIVQTWKDHPKANCSSQYLVYKQCVNSAKSKCVIQDPIIQSKVQMVYDDFLRNETFFCEEGMFVTLTTNEQNALRSTCSPKLFKKAAKCKRKYKARFGKNKGSKALCKWHYKARQCMVNALQRNCKATDLRKYFVSFYSFPYNPYCEGGGDYVKKEPKGDPGFGQCTQKSYAIKSRECIFEFVQTLQKNNGQQCRATVDAILMPCVAKRIKRCLRGTRDGKSLNDEVKRTMDYRRTLTQNEYCEGGYLETLPLSKDQCTPEYFETFQQRCYNKFIIEYKKNRGSPKLCQYFAEVNRCARNMTLTMCTLDQPMKDYANFLYDSFNPFCPDGKDPPITPHHASHDKRKTSLTNRGIAHALSSVLLLLNITVSMSSW